jgi:hypothetical protein
VRCCGIKWTGTSVVRALLEDEDEDEDEGEEEEE